MPYFKVASSTEIDTIIRQSNDAFLKYSTSGLQQRAQLLKGIADELAQQSEVLIDTAMKETHLPQARLRQELTRTLFQLTSYGEACEKGNWLEARIDTAIPNRNPPKPDLRKTMLPLGPVVVFGASNFPFAYSTAGGDTACALAAGCSVIVKAHPAHAETSELVAQLITRAVAKNQLPPAVFSHIHGAGFETGKLLVTHELVKAVGFTGSYSGGKALFDWANQRTTPIPVFAEMGSINPVYLFPEGLAQRPKDVALQYAQSITLSSGQFCTNPGLIIGIESPELDAFINTLSTAIESIEPATMLHPGIAKAFAGNRAKALMQAGVTTRAVAATPAKENQGIPTIALTDADHFLANPQLKEEVFGPYSLVVICKNPEQMKQVATQMHGQLTSTIIATPTEMQEQQDLVNTITKHCGRIIANGVPTGVEVCLSMQHGGPFPATTDPRYTSVGADGIKRFCRPVCFQNWPDALLPDELKDANPLRIWRTVNNELSQNSVTR